MTAGLAGISYLEPGVDGIINTQENAVFYGDQRLWNFYKLNQALISGTARDLGNTPTTELRAGLLMAFDISLGKWVHFLHGDTTTDLGEIHGVLFASIQTQKDGADQDRFVGAISFGGLWRSEGLIASDALNTAPGLASSTGEAATRQQIRNGVPWVRLSDWHEQFPVLIPA